MPQHVISELDLEIGPLQELFEVALEYKYNFDNRNRKLLEGCNFAWLFYEESTRTRFSFEMAARHLGGGGSSSEMAGQTSSAAKGESLYRTLRNISQYRPNAIIVRHDKDGQLQDAVQRLHNHLRMPVFNAGDGGNKHPTQMLVNLFTKWELLRSGRLPRDKPLTIMFYGDNAGSRTINSDCLGLAKYGRGLGINVKRIFFVGKNGHGRPREDASRALEEDGVDLAYMDLGGIGHSGIDRVTLLAMFHNTDITSVTRYQDNRRPKDAPDETLVLEEEYVEYAPAHMKVLHPQPAKSEIPESLDDHPKVVMHEQSENGLYIRSAMYHLWTPRNL